jgi:hypothetical protein
LRFLDTNNAKHLFVFFCLSDHHLPTKPFTLIRGIQAKDRQHFRDFLLPDIMRSLFFIFALLAMKAVADFYIYIFEVHRKDGDSREYTRNLFSSQTR